MGMSQSVIDGLNTILLPFSAVVVALGAARLIFSGGRVGKGMIAAGVGFLILTGFGRAIAILAASTPATKRSAKPSPTGSPSSESHTHRVQHAPGNAPDVPWAWLLFIGAVLVILAIAVILVVLARHRLLTAQATASERAKLNRRWTTAVAALDATTSQWLVYDKDVNAILAAPAMKDPGCATTAACITAMGAADNLRNMRPRKGTPLTEAHSAVKEFETAVAEFSRTFTVAKAFAKGAALRNMDKQERDLLTQAQDALQYALHGATEGERNNAYRHVKRLMDRLGIDMPSPARDALEARVRQQITAGPALTLVKDA